METKKILLTSGCSSSSNHKRLLCFLLCLSLTINALFSWLLFLRHWETRAISEEGWSREAGEEAEAVASIPCSGHGSAFLDGLLIDGKSTASCECNAGFTGSDCSQKLSSTDYVVDVDGGNPLFLEPFWRKHASSSAVLVAGWHRIGYVFGDGSLYSAELEKRIRELHASVGNAVTQGKYIVFGTGSMQLVNAAVYALSSTMSSSGDNYYSDSASSSSKSSPVKVVAAVPYYQGYKDQTEFFRSDLYEFRGDASVWTNDSRSSSSNRFIEFVTSPNNPDSQLKRAVLQPGPNVRTIHDRAYHWPHFTSISTPADEDLMLFTLSKLTGHAGSRFGWALVKDEAVYQRMSRYVMLNTIGVSHDTQLRALQLLKVVLEKGGGGRESEIFEFGYRTMSDRWRRLNQVFSSSRRFSLQEIRPEFCNFRGRVKEPSPAYAWMKCNSEEEAQDCYQALLSAGIKGRDGRVFGGADGHRYTRLTLLKNQDDFELLMNKVEKLVSSENFHYAHQTA